MKVKIVFLPVEVWYLHLRERGGKEDQGKLGVNVLDRTRTSISWV